MAEPFKLRFNFDVSTFRLLGRELITDRVTALFELVKNCYDANSNEVRLDFHDTSKLSSESYISIKDDGTGMSLNDIRFKWMVIGTNSKRTDSVSPAPYSRRYVGEKGVGRFAVEKLGSKVEITTTQKGTTRKIKLELDWTQYEKLARSTAKRRLNDTTYFTEIDNRCWIENCSADEHGTTIKIYLGLTEQLWSENDINRIYSELSKLVSPLIKLAYPFKILVNSNEFTDYSDREVVNKSIDFSSNHYKLSSYEENGAKYQEYLSFNEKSGILEKKKGDLKIFGPIKFEFYYFDKNEIRRYKNSYKGETLDGITIYRDGLITTPFAENEVQQIRKRDILGIDKRRYSGFFDKVSTNNLIGFVDITKEYNTKIKDATNRQDFIDCPEYQKLKEYIIDQIHELEKFLTYEKKHNTDKAIKKLADAHIQLSKISSIITEISNDASPSIKTKLSEINRQAVIVQRNVYQGLKQYQQLKEESQRKEDLFFSLLSLQDYAAELSHMVRTTLANIKSMAEFFVTDFPNPVYDDLFKEYAKSIFDEMGKLSTAIKFMLSYARSNSNFENFEVFSIIDYLFNNVYKIRFDELEIKAILEYSQKLEVNQNKKFFEDIFENLISNSIKALKNTEDKVIKCTGNVEEDKVFIRFSDNGCGIPEDEWESIFEIFKTTTQNEGGAGIGLFTVRKRIEALGGEIKVIRSEFGDIGATFLITLPFKNK
jgi:signal transduction histidine kinase